jgi:hypothetical protein
VAHQVCVLSRKYCCFGMTCEARVATLIEHPVAIWQQKEEALVKALIKFDKS